MNEFFHPLMAQIMKKIYFLIVAVHNLLICLEIHFDWH